MDDERYKCLIVNPLTGLSLRPAEDADEYLILSLSGKDADSTTAILAYCESIAQSNPGLSSLIRQRLPEKDRDRVVLAKTVSKRGGQITKAKHGPEYYREIGRKGMAVRRERREG